MKKKSIWTKRLICLLILSLICAAAVFAADADDSFGLKEKMQVLLNFITSPWVKGIACIALIVECIALITAGRQEPGMFKKFIPWIVGTILFMAAGTITTAFVNTNNHSAKTVMDN